MSSEHSSSSPSAHGHGHRRPRRVRRPGTGEAPGPLPLVIGVTGHRDLRPDDIPALEALVRRVVEEVKDAHPHTPLMLLSPLAEGSDRLVARVGLELGVRLVVPLPLPLELYERDFASDESRTEFHRLLGLAESSYVLPLMRGNTHEGIGQHGEQRNRQYAQVGALIARQSQVFLALWDGASDAANDKVGGTAEVVRFRLDGVPPSYEPTSASPLSYSSSGPVYHLVTPRINQPMPPKALTSELLLPTRQTAASFDELQGW